MANNKDEKAGKLSRKEVADMTRKQLGIKEDNKKNISNINKRVCIFI